MTKQDDYNTKLEKYYVGQFFQTQAGKEWIDNNNLSVNSYEKISLAKTEHPDFVFTSNTGKHIGLEITQIYTDTKNGKATQNLNTTLKKVCSYVEEKHQIYISIVLQIFDKRRFSSSWKDMESLCYNPGFSKIFNYRNLKQELIEFIDKNIKQIKNFQLVRHTFNFENELFDCRITLPLQASPKESDWHVNNTGWCKKIDTTVIQNSINVKNQKYERYLKKCDECHLLIVIPSAAEGNYAYCDEKLSGFPYDSKFKSINFVGEKRNVSYSNKKYNLQNKAITS